MALYNVDIYGELKLRFHGIEAKTPEAAANIARDGLPEVADDIAPCDGDTFAAFVDVVGDEEFSQSQVIDFNSPEKPIVVITVRGGLVQTVHSIKPVTAFVEDWDCPPDEPRVMDFESEPLTPAQDQRIEERLAVRNDQLLNERKHP